MKILYICLDHYPNDGACTSLLNNLFGEDSLLNGNEIHVLTPKYCVEEISKEVINDVHIQRFFSWGFISKIEIVKLIKKNPIKAIWGVMKKRLFFKKNTSCFYQKKIAKEVFQALKKIRANQYDVVIPVVGSIEVAVASLVYKRKEGGKQIFYQVDPCSTNAAFSKETYNERLNFEKEIYRCSEGVVTTPIIYNEMKDKFLKDKDVLQRVYTMEFPNIVTKFTKDLKYNDDAKTGIVCLFAGRIYSTIRNPLYTFRLFNNISDKKIKLQLIGVEKKEVQEYSARIELKENIKCYGLMDYDKVKEKINDANILVNIGNSMTNQVPSKVFEYISSGKPIINICKSRNCPSLSYLKNYPFVLNLFEEDAIFEMQSQQLESFILKNSKNFVSKDYIYKEFEKCTAAYCAKQWIEIIKTVIKENE